MKRATILAGLAVAAVVMAMAPFSRPTEAQATCFQATGFCITNPAFERYYDERGEERILGYPVSRSFTLEGFEVQIFQRVVLQLQADGVERLNILDPGIMPMTRANQSVFPASDPTLAARAPRAGSDDYSAQVVEFVRQAAPDTFETREVGFFNLFNTTVPIQPDTDPDLVTLLNLEIWGVPTSGPAYDPANRGFVYQRFQRGIMHFRAEVPVTEGILVGEYFKAVISGQNLPPDLAEDMRGTRYIGQYSPSAPNAVARPAELLNTNMTNAFEPGTGAAAMPQPRAARSPVPLATAIPGDPLPTVTIQLDEPVIAPRTTIRVLVIARDDRGLDQLELQGQEGIDVAFDTGDAGLDRARSTGCDNLTECAGLFTLTPARSGRFVLVARARDSAGQLSEPATAELSVDVGAAPATPAATVTPSTPTATPTATATATVTLATPATP